MNTYYSRDLRRAAIACGALLLLAFSAVRGQDNQPAEVIKVYSNLVSVPVIVSDRDGCYIPGLRQEDFKLYDNNTQQTLSWKEFLAKLSEVSAGRFYQSKKTDLKKTFVLIAEELRNQYRLGFVPDSLARDGSLHSLRVKVDKPEVAVRARTQYRAIPSQ